MEVCILMPVKFPEAGCGSSAPQSVYAMPKAVGHGMDKVLLPCENSKAPAC